MFSKKRLDECARLFRRRPAVLHEAATGIVAAATVPGIKSVMGTREHVNLNTRKEFSGVNARWRVVLILLGSDFHQRDTIRVIIRDVRAHTVHGDRGLEGARIRRSLHGVDDVAVDRDGASGKPHYPNSGSVYGWQIREMFERAQSILGLSDFATGQLSAR